MYFVTKSATRAIATALPYTLATTKEATELQNLYNAIFIVELTAPKINLSFGYLFCNWSYAMVSVALKSTSLTQKILFKD